MSDRVRLKSIELLYGWSQLLLHEPKVKEAYQMLKNQGIIKYDPVHVDKVGHNPNPSTLYHVIYLPILHKTSQAPDPAGGAHDTPQTS